jgi:hypothetical protein
MKNSLVSIIIVLLGLVIIVGYSQSSNSTLSNNFLSFSVDGRTVAMADRATEPLRLLPIIRRDGHVWIPVLLINAAVEQVKIDRYWNLFSIRGIDFKIGSSEMHISQLPPTSNYFNDTIRFPLPIAPISFNNLWYVPLEPVMLALGHSVKMSTSILIQRGNSPKTLLSGIKPYQKQ